MTDIKTIEYWKSRLDAEIKAEPKSEAQEYHLKKGYLMRCIYEQIKEYNEIDDQEVRTKWHWWYMYSLAKRTLRLFKVKDVYKSKKATEYWRKRYMTKVCKMKGKGLNYPGKGTFIYFLKQCKEDDRENAVAWDYVINYLDNKYKGD